MCLPLQQPMNRAFVARTLKPAAASGLNAVHYVADSGPDSKSSFGEPPPGITVKTPPMSNPLLCPRSIERSSTSLGAQHDQSRHPYSPLAKPATNASSSVTSL
jgi:hypothetical protein